MISKSKSKQRCVKYRKTILDLSQKVSALHIGGAFSCVEILDTIYNNLMTKNDKFILSKGHTAIIQYVILKYKNYLTKKDLENFCTKKGILGVHPDYGTSGIEASTGSLGHGLGIAAGLALGNKKNYVYVVMSDGELMEGSTWEMALTIAALKINNIILIIDNNDLQSATKSKDTHPNLYPIDKKFKSFGWQALNCNGHKIDEIYKKIKLKKKNRPFVLVAKTIKGYPVSFMMNQPLWHYRAPNKHEYKNALKEIKK